MQATSAPRRPLILVIEDNEDVASLLQHLLHQAGFDMRLVTDGAGALKALQAPPPALVLLDLLLPQHSGFDILRQLRQQPGWEQLPVVILTGHTDDDDVQRARRLGASDFITKPFAPKTLVQRIRQLVS